jgi:hypothetical protein
MRKLQKEISTKIGVYGWVGGVTEYDSEFLPTPEPGPYELDEGFDKIFNFDILQELVIKYHKKFIKETTKKIDPNDFHRIELGLKAYVKSSTKKSIELNILKVSITNAYGDILLNSFQQADEGVRQFYGNSYFESIEELFVEAESIINAQSIMTYRKLATKYTLKCISEFLKKTDSVWDLEDLEVFRGLGNYQYYKRKPSKNVIDFISKFSGIGKEPFEYFERQIFNSFTISERLAERFMVQKTNRRRAKITTTLKVVSANMFSSFIVCDKFNINQYEILCLPFSNRHYIFEEVNDKFSADFFISDNENYPSYRCGRAKID